MEKFKSPELPENLSEHQRGILEGVGLESIGGARETLDEIDENIKNTSEGTLKHQ